MQIVTFCLVVKEWVEEKRLKSENFEGVLAVLNLRFGAGPVGVCFSIHFSHSPRFPSTNAEAFFILSFRQWVVGSTC